MSPVRTTRGRGAAARSQRYWPLLVVVVGVVLGLLVAFAGDDTWQIGCVLVGTSLAIGAVIRLALPAGDAGLLQVRSKVFDIAFLTLAGGAIIALAVLVPGGR